MAEGDIENAIWSERAVKAGEWLDRQRQFKELQIPFTEIENWDDWHFQCQKWLWQQDRKAFEIYQGYYHAPWERTIRQLHNFTVTTIEIEKVTPGDPSRLAQVCAIFEKMNSTGVRLSVYDLLATRLYKYGVDLHLLWKKAVEKHSLLNQFSGGRPDEYGVFVLRALALMRGLDAKGSTLINLKAEGFAEDWQQAARYMEQAFQRITSTTKDGFGVFDPKWMPYSTMISPLAAMLAAIDKGRMGHRAYKLLRQWYWSSALCGRYAGSVETTIYRDYQDFLRSVEDEHFVSDVLMDAQNEILDNRNYTLRNKSRMDAVYRGIMCLIALRGAKDFCADDSIEFHALDDHHIFPKAYLKKIKRADGHRYTDDEINCIINRTLSATSTNLRISRSSPSRYVRELVPASRVDEIMASHFINTEALQAMYEDDFERFLYHREQALIDEIRHRVAGV